MPRFQERPRADATSLTERVRAMLHNLAAFEESGGEYALMYEIAFNDAAGLVRQHGKDVVFAAYEHDFIEPVEDASAASLHRFLTGGAGAADPIYVDVTPGGRRWARSAKDLP